VTVDRKHASVGGPAAQGRPPGGLGRRRLLSALPCAGCGVLLSALLPRCSRAQDEAGALAYDAEQTFPPVEARYYKKLAEKKIECTLCPNRCRVADLERGSCGVRENRGGTYYTLVHSRAASANVDPIEKKPFFHFLPGTSAFSIATAGCNMECKFCQNWQLSQYRPEQVRAMRLPPARVHELARQSGARSIAYTYSEPTIYYEYMFDTATLSGQTGIRSVVVSAGFIEEQPLKDLLPHVAAVKIDLKAFRQGFYDRVSRGQLKVVQQTLEAVRKAGKWLEIVVLVVPTFNDSEAEVRDLARHVKQHLSAEVPVHFTRFHPTYRLRSLPSTPVSTLERCRDVALAEGLQFVYMGNVAGHPAENTYCPGCREPVILRMGMAVADNRLKGGCCPKCGRVLPGVWG
jgi:pyruvate formate lyase activating enzyme